jgi:hypothetical protein
MKDFGNSLKGKVDCLARYRLPSESTWVHLSAQ